MLKVEVLKFDITFTSRKRVPNSASLLYWGYRSQWFTAKFNINFSARKVVNDHNIVTCVFNVDASYIFHENCIIYIRLQPLSLKWRDVGHPQKPSPPSIKTFFSAAMLNLFARLPRFTKERAGEWKDQTERRKTKHNINLHTFISFRQLHFYNYLWNFATFHAFIAFATYSAGVVP